MIPHYGFTSTSGIADVRSDASVLGFEILPLPSERLGTQKPGSDIAY